MEHIADWLLEQEPYIRYRTYLDLLDEDPDSAIATKTYRDTVADQKVQLLLDEIETWPGPVMKRHNDAKLLYHKLVFLVDIGIGRDEPAIRQVVEKILRSASADGPFQITGNIPTVFGGSGLDEPMWMLCDAPLIVYSLVKLGLGNEPGVQRAMDHLLTLVQDFGWPCAATSALGSRFKGPGKWTHPCPYANLLMLKLIAAMPSLHTSRETETGIEMLLDMWKHRRNKKYFLFGMGTDFSKLKAPYIWFDILHVAEVLSQYSAIRSDPGFLEMIDLIRAAADEEGLYSAGSVYRAWGVWDFGQKKFPSPWITMLVYRILNRINE